MTDKHTPGPWEAVDNSWEISSVYSAQSTVAECRIDPAVTEDNQHELEPIKEANARLIAKAPDLLKLAQRIAALNRDAGEIGAGMLASLVDEARRLTE